MKPTNKIEKEITCGIYETSYVARIYKNFIIIVIPYIKWTGQTGNLAYMRCRIDDQKTMSKINEALINCDEDAAWSIIGQEIQDSYLAQ